MIIGMPAGGKVTWSEIKQLAEDVDSVYNSKLPNDRPKDPECVARKTQTSFSPGIPELAKDVTTPFPITFPVSKTLYQRFEFAYYNQQGGEYMYKHYLNRENRPVYHSEYLTTGFTANAKTYVPPGSLGLNATAENVCNLIESKRQLLWKWWPECGMVSDSEEIAAELYFVTDVGSVCPCPGMYRVAYSVSGGNNGNGNGVSSSGFQPYTAYGAIHSWSLKSACTLEQIDFAKLKPEDGTANASTYPEPATGCCARMVFPTLGSEGGGGDQYGGGLTMYDVRLFDKGYVNAITDPYTKVVEDMTWETYLERMAAGTIPEHCPADRPDLYDQYSRHEMWNMCKEGGSAGIRITPLRFQWLSGGSSGTPMVSIVWVPTSVTVQLKGKFQPAIRKRWYDMIYYKLKHIAGCYPPNGGNYPHGTSWNYSGEMGLKAYDRECSRYLALGYGWAKHEGAEYVGEAFYGEKFWEQYLCVKNYANGVTCPGSGEYNAEPGCYCSEESGNADDCRDLACSRNIQVPWEGGCENDSCEGGMKTHWASVDYLQKIKDFISSNKQSEALGGLVGVADWKSCAVKYQKGEQYSLKYSYTYTSFMLPSYDGHTYTYGLFTFLSGGTLNYWELTYEDQGCSGCSEDQDCPMYASGMGPSGTIILVPQEGIPVCAGMAWTTILQPSPPSNRKLRIQGDIGGLLLPGDTYNIVGDEENPCREKDAPEENEHPVIMGPAPGGVITIRVAYGPNGGSMKTAQSISFTRDSEENTQINEEIDLQFSPTDYQYRFNVVIYVEAWCAGEGENNPYTLLTNEGGCFTPSQASLSVTIS